MRASYLSLSLVVLGASAPSVWADDENCTIKDFNKERTGHIATIGGHYVSGFERSDFYPCESAGGKAWWFSAGGNYEVLNADARKMSGGPTGHDDKRVFVAAKACISEEGSFGHLGSYPRMVEVLELIEHHPELADDCARIK